MRISLCEGFLETSSTARLRGRSPPGTLLNPRPRQPSARCRGGGKANAKATSSAITRTRPFPSSRREEERLSGTRARSQTFTFPPCTYVLYNSSSEIFRFHFPEEFFRQDYYDYYGYDEAAGAAAGGGGGGGAFPVDIFQTLQKSFHCGNGSATFEQLIRWVMENKQLCNGILGLTKR